MLFVKFIQSKENRLLSKKDNKVLLSFKRAKCVFNTLTILSSLLYLLFITACDHGKKSNVERLFSEDVTRDSIVEFGRYEVYEEGTISPIKWRVLDINLESILLITNECFIVKEYNNQQVAVTWDQSSIRRWLNNEFYNTAFNDEIEKFAILETQLTTPDNKDFGTLGGEDTADRIFLFSQEEIQTYFINAKDRVVYPTKKAISEGVRQFSGSSTLYPGSVAWWSRTPGYLQSYASDIYNGGDIGIRGNFVSSKKSCVRPAMWVKLKY